jgi:hypothetical protein
MNNLKTELLYEVTKNDRTYKFYIPVGAPLGEIYDVCYALFNDIVQEANEAAKQAKPATKEEAPEVAVEIVE